MRTNVSATAPPPPPEGWPYPGIGPGFPSGVSRRRASSSSSSSSSSGDSVGDRRLTGGFGTWRRALQQADSSNSSNSSNSSAPMRQELNWVLMNKVTPVRNQYSPGLAGFGCGSCWAFATVAAIESAYLISKNLSASQVRRDVGSGCRVGGWENNLTPHTPHPHSPPSAHNIPTTPTCLSPSMLLLGVMV